MSAERCSRIFRCRWCYASFKDVDLHRDHEEIHMNLDILNGCEDPRPQKRGKFNSEPLSSPVPGPSNDPSYEALPVPGPSNDPSYGALPVPGPSNNPSYGRYPPTFENEERSKISQIGRGSNDTELSYNFQKVSEKTFKNSVVDTHYKVTVTPGQASQGVKLSSLHEELVDLFDDVIDEAGQGLEGNDLIRVIVHHEGLANGIVIPLRPFEKTNGREVVHHIENVLTSHQDLPMDASFYVDVGTMQLPKGGINSLPINVLSGDNNSISRKRSLIEIINDDNLCMIRAILMAFLNLNQLKNEEWRELVKGNLAKTTTELVLHHKKCPVWFYADLTKKRHATRLTGLALEFTRQVGLPTNRQMTTRDISVFEETLNVDILVVSAQIGNKFIRVPQDEESEKQRLYLYLVEGGRGPHFHAITNICGFFGAARFCTRCLKPYKDLHQCYSKCFVCKRKQDCVEDKECQMSCRNCHMSCRSLECFRAHREEKRGKEQKSQCELWWKCVQCQKVMETKKVSPKEHCCDQYECKSCKRLVDRDHHCYIRSLECKESKPHFVFFDFECTQQDDIVQCENGYVPSGNADCPNCNDKTCRACSLCENCGQSCCGKYQHVPNLVVAHTVCPDCIDVDDVGIRCESCGTRCSKCNKLDRKSKCYVNPPCPDTCGFRETVFRGKDTKSDFARWLFNESHKGFTAIAHNMKGYDGYFLLEYLIDCSMRPDNIIYSGSKIMYFHLSKGLNIRVLDSLNFMPMKLSKLPSAFGLEEMKKGYFPHLFNTMENQEYRGPYPAAHYYGCDYMNFKDRLEFMEWHAEKMERGEIFDFAEEILAYCRSDVDILRKACLKFRHILLSVTGKDEVVMDDETGTLDTRVFGGVDPFDSITIASVCMKVFKTNFLKENWQVKLRRGAEISEWLPAVCRDGGMAVLNNGVYTSTKNLQSDDYVIEEKEFLNSPIAQVPAYGYSSRDQYSMSSIKWLEWVMEENKRKGAPMQIRHALNGGEVRLPGTKYRLDGFCEVTNTVYEYQGCYWHGCPICFRTQRRQTKVPRTGQSLEELYALTIKKEKYVRELGYNYVEIWEHDFQKLMKTNEAASCFVNSLDLQPRLNPRDSFFGGRTNATKLYYKTKEGEKIHYLDFCSLYPSVNKYAKYPLKEPTIITDDFGNIEDYFGMAKVKILPPRGLYHPVLPVRTNGKLTFPLCLTCAEKQSQSTCACTDEERCLTGTWCTPEIMKALQCGYTLLKIYEVYHWNETSEYNPDTRDGGLFDTYINLFLKIKQEASGWPSWVKTEEDADRYVRSYEEKEGITLDPKNIEKNLALRSIAKLLLNSFWGKFGQRKNMPQNTFYHESEADKFFQCISDPAKIVKDFYIVSKDTIQVTWENKETAVKEDFTTNVFLASFTTSWARLKLYGVLEMLKERVLYFDTDSVIFVSRPDDEEPEVGSFLGQLTSELDDDDYIVEFVSGGPKNYAYMTHKGRQACKVRGFSLNFVNSGRINFHSMLSLVCGPDSQETDAYDGVITVTNPAKISREKRKRKIYNREERKDYKIVYSKRVIQKDSYDTLPYGY